MTQPDLTNLYKTRAAARLETAGLLLRDNPACQFTTAQEADLARSDIGMMIWSAAIDLGSILLLQERQTEPTGRSPQVSQFITRDLHQQHPRLSLDVAWSILVQLHNIQHRAGHAPSRFGRAATAARRSIAVLNHLLHRGNQIDPRSYSWLARVREQYVDPFRGRPACAVGPYPTRELEHANSGHWDSTTALGSAEPRSRRRRNPDHPRRTRRRQEQFQRNPTAPRRQKRTTRNDLQADTPRRRHGRLG